MKRAFFVFLFFCILVLYCTAQERDANNGALPLSFYSGQPVPQFDLSGGLTDQASAFGFLLGNPPLDMNTLEWQQADFGLTKYADYNRRSFFDVASPVFKGILMVGGIVLFAYGVGVLITGDQSSNPDGVYSALLMTGGLGIFAGGLVWTIVD